MSNLKHYLQAAVGGILSDVKRIWINPLVIAFILLCFYTDGLHALIGFLIVSAIISVIYYGVLAYIKSDQYAKAKNGSKNTQTNTAESTEHQENKESKESKESNEATQSKNQQARQGYSLGDIASKRTETINGLIKGSGLGLLKEKLQSKKSVKGSDENAVNTVENLTESNDSAQDHTATETEALTENQDQSFVQATNDKSLEKSDSEVKA